MGKYLKKFETTSQYNAYTADTANFIKPNVSLITDTNTVEYNPWVETMVVAKYNVTSTTSPTPIGYNKYTSGFSAIEIDGVAQPSVVSAYTFSTTGEHTVKYTLADSTTIGDMAFNGCAITSIDIPNSVTSIGDYAFYHCGGLTSINIPDSVTSIESNAFDDCTSLTSVTIGSGVTSISQGAFWCGTNLSKITSLRTTAITLPTSGQPVFRVASSGTLKVPTGSIGYDAWLTLLGSGWSIQYI